jgi:hypothetical protein
MDNLGDGRTSHTHIACIFGTPSRNTASVLDVSSFVFDIDFCECGQGEERWESVEELYIAVTWVTIRMHNVG